MRLEADLKVCSYSLQLSLHLQRCRRRRLPQPNVHTREDDDAARELERRRRFVQYQGCEQGSAERFAHDGERYGERGHLSQRAVDRRVADDLRDERNEYEVDVGLVAVAAEGLARQ